VCINGPDCERPVPDPRVCSPSGSFCIDASSHLTSLFVYTTVGSDTDDVVGGFQSHHYLCFVGYIFPWLCTRSSGGNDMAINDAYRGLLHQTLPVLYKTRVEARNTDHVSDSLWSLGTTITIPGDNGSPAGVGNPSGSPEADVSGVCGSHPSFSTTPPAMVSTNTTDGDFPDCERTGVSGSGLTTCAVTGRKDCINSADCGSQATCVSGCCYRLANPSVNPLPPAFVRCDKCVTLASWLAGRAPVSNVINQLP
jgi:hypothetical protein